MIKQEDFMWQAIKEALKAKKKHEVPVGAIVVDNTKNTVASVKFKSLFITFYHPFFFYNLLVTLCLF